MKKRNAQIRKTANKINLAGTIILTVCVMISGFLFLTGQSPAKGLLGILVIGFIAFIVLRGAAWMVGGFAQKTIPKQEPAAVAGQPSTPTADQDPTQGSRFLHTNSNAPAPAKNPFLPS
jgi:predicted phage tail protein